MALARRISYQWRMFIPMVLVIWVIMGGISWWQISRLKQRRIDTTFERLKFVTERINDLDGNVDEIRSFLSFINSYYGSEDGFDDIMVRVGDTTSGVTYNYNVHGITNLGENFKKGQGETTLATTDGTSLFFLYCMCGSADGSRSVLCLLPYSAKLTQTGSDGFVRFWLIMAAIGLFFTVMAYISTRHEASTINFLREFTRRAARREDFNVESANNLPNDRLGDIARDIVAIYVKLTDEMNRSEQEHRVAINAIEDKTRIKRELTSNINHEIKTPIGIIKGYVDTILADPDMPEDTRHKFLIKIQENADRLTELIADITVITKYEQGEKSVTISDIDFHDLVYTFADELKMTNHGENPIPFTFSVPLKCTVSGNETLLRGMLANLVSNARAYSQGSMCRLQYEREDADFYYFSFYDDGVGVPPEAIPRLFDRFFRLSHGRARNAGGSGLGLSIVKVAVESVGGKIEVDNRIPSGLEFHFTLAKYKGKVRGGKPNTDILANQA